MNTTVSETIEFIVNHTEPAIRDDVVRHLRACNFSSADDPMLNGLAVQAALASQPLRLAQADGAKFATKADVALLGDRMESTAWSVGKLRLGPVALACFLCFAIGASGTAVSFKLWGASLAGFFDLPRASDARLTTLNEVGAVLHVERNKGAIYLYIDGDVKASAGHTNDGLNYMYLKAP